MRGALKIPGVGWADREAQRQRAEAMIDQTVIASPPVSPVTFEQRTKNPLRPSTLDQMIGQHRMRQLLRRMIDSAQKRDVPLDHLLLVGPSGFGKSTIANIVANELGVDVYQVEAPVSHETLLTLREQMKDGDVLFIDEIHQQAIMERRGRTTNTQPEVLFSIMEDRTIVSDMGVLPFPEITLIGATTDEGMLPDPFINRFPIRPAFEPYTDIELGVMAHENAQALGSGISAEACLRFAHASRGTPRQINNYVKMATSLSAGLIDEDLALEVLHLQNVTHDGLTQDMQNTLTFLATKCERATAEGDVKYQASIGRIATGIGKSRDSKAVALRIEPWLIEQGYLSAGHGGRELTPMGVARAFELLEG